MEAALNLEPQSRGAELLLHHCLNVGRADDVRAPAVARLEQALGGELTHLLLFALAPRQRRCGSSSP